MDFSYSSIQKVIFFNIGSCTSLRFKTENDIASPSEVWQMFPYSKWIPVPSRKNILPSISQGILQQLKSFLFILMSLRNDQKFMFMDKLASQCVCAQSVRPWSLQLPLSAEQVMHFSQCAPRLAMWDRIYAGGCHFDFPNSFYFHRTCHCVSSSDVTCGNTCRPLCECRFSEAGAVSEAEWDLT